MESLESPAAPWLRPWSWPRNLVSSIIPVELKFGVSHMVDLIARQLFSPNFTNENFFKFLKWNFHAECNAVHFFGGSGVSKRSAAAFWWRRRLVAACITDAGQAIGNRELSHLLIYPSLTEQQRPVDSIIRFYKSVSRVNAKLGRFPAKIIILKE